MKIANTKHLLIMLGIIVSGMIWSCDSDDPYEKYGGSSANANSNAWYTGSNASDAMRLEMPALNRNRKGVQFVTHYANMTDENLTKMFNYSIEFDSATTHSRWVAFHFNDSTKRTQSNRTDAWDVDPTLPTSWRLPITAYGGSGYTRGHLCASADRLFSTEANQQTFYMSNMSPQLYNFNSYYWAGFESKVRDWANTYKALYVAKGGTIRTDQRIRMFPTKNVNGKDVQVAVPRYYFMAILAETKSGSYQALAFWVEHKDYPGYAGGNYPSGNVMKQHVISIDALEELTGIDFFCNLNDALENAVEKSVNINAWKF